MQRLILFVIIFAAGVGLMAPSSKTEAPVAEAAAAEPGLFEAAPYKETELKRRSNGHFYTTAEVNGVPITFVVDTGATMVALTEADARRAGIKFSESEFVPVARTANGVAMGKEIVLKKVAIEGKEVVSVGAAIVQNADVSLLGQAYLARITGVQMNGDTMVLR